MLFEFEAENDASIIAQGALLLSYYSTSSERHLNTFWLRIAIQSARADHAHHYDNDKSLTGYKRQMKKRLWWCCILRDRIMPLGLRRPLQITGNHLNSAGQGLTEEDFDEDIGKSEVYDTETQHLLAKILVAQCKLAIEMTDVITMVYPADAANLVIAACEEDFNRISVETEKVKMKLIDWYETVDQWISTVLGKSHASVLLYASLLYIYYHSARLALFHHKILALEMWTSSLGEGQDTYVRQLDLFGGELRSSAAAVTHIVQDLLRLNLGQYLPISTVAYTALPLVLSVLDVKVPANPSQPRMHYVETYHKSMELYLNRYSGIGEVSSMMERILEEAESNSRKVCLPPAFFSQREANHPSSSTSDWYEIFLLQPKFHLRVVLSFDLSFSNGKFPEDSDFPKQLRADQLEEVPYSHSLMLGEKNIDTNVLASLFLQVSTLTLDRTDLEAPNMTPARRDLDFMDLINVTTRGRVWDMSMDLDLDAGDGDGDDFMDFFVEERNGEEGADDDRGWERVIWDLFDHAIPG
ncbi:hypothetical protein VE04_09296 [Pseudogymnoascus sp. 24MN13]|nr:hypothetical protein VE04_09296 [Pseudogymnoascus sp. 24MN13]